MLKIVVPGIELYNEVTNEFSQTKDTELQLEHSLVSISKWESRWHKAFLTKKDKTLVETLDYIRCMTLTQNVDDWVYKSITPELMQQISGYIEDPMTATYFYSDKLSQPTKETVTSELIYYWMVAFQIPFECQRWHLNRLLTLIDVCNRKNKPPKGRMSAAQIRAQNRALNDSRRASLNTKG